VSPILPLCRTYKRVYCRDMDILVLLLVLILLPALIKILRDSLDGILDVLLAFGGIAAVVCLCVSVYRDVTL
ncbi:MAG TPA: hypothetical protein VFW73_03155, partial [Lacipirellulaceae bacterium]|nr:hypothetical protein [Lacipirellulaceae bacterium]